MILEPETGQLLICFERCDLLLVVIKKLFDNHIVINKLVDELVKEHI